MMLFEGNVYFYLNGQRVYTPTPMQTGWDSLGLCDFSIGSDFGQGVLHGSFSNVCVTDKARYIGPAGEALDSFPLSLPETMNSYTRVLVQGWPALNYVPGSRMSVVPDISKVVMPSMQQNMPNLLNVPAYNFSTGAAQGRTGMLRLNQEWTIEAWVYWTGSTSGGRATWLDLSEASPSVACSFYIDSSSRSSIFFPLEGQWRTATGRTVTPNKWTHIAWVKGLGENFVECFIDGRSAGYPEVPNGWWNTSSSVTIGANVSFLTVPSLHWSGNLSQVSIRNRRNYRDRFDPVPNNIHITEGTDLLFFLGPNFTDIRFSGAVATLTTAGTVPTAKRVVEDAN